MSRFLKASQIHYPLYLLVHDIRSVHNVASFFRTAECAGVTHIYISGFSPEPLDRFGRDRSDFAKVALGAEKRVPWTHVEDPRQIILDLKKQNVSILALEQNEKSIDYKTFVPNGPMFLIVGREVEGISDELLALADTILEIPMRGEKESLNVSVATGIALFHLAGL